MKRLFFIGCWALILTLLIPDRAEGGTFVSSLRREIRTLPDSDKLMRLNELLYTNTHNKVYEVYADLLLEEAQRQHNDYYEGDALLFLIRYCYMQDPDSLRIYPKITKLLFIVTNQIEELCRTKGWNIYSLVNERMQELVVREMDSLRNFATCFNYPGGVDMADQALANFYSNMGLDEEDIQLSRGVLPRMEERSTSRMRWCYVLRSLLTRDLRLECLDKLDSCVQEREEEGIIRLDAEYTVAFLRGRYHYYSAQHYAAEKKSSLVYQHSRMTEDIEKENNTDAERTLPQFLRMNYCTLAGEYGRAIDLANRLELMFLGKGRLSDWVSVEDFKTDLYYKLGRGMEAAGAYRDSREMHDLIMRAKCYKDLAKLKA